MLTFFFPILDYLNNGPLVRRIVVICLRVFAGIGILAGVAAVIAALKLAFMAGTPTSVSFAGLLLAALFLGSAACVAQVCLYRGAKIGTLEPGRYIFIGIAAHLCRMAGEIMATVLATLGVAAFLTAVVAGSSVGPLEEILPGPFGRMASSGFSGFVALLFALALAFADLVLGYLLAEGLKLCTDVAVDVRSLAFSSGREAFAVSGPTPSSASMGVVCSNCGSRVEPGNGFCTSCGLPVARTAHA
jgi:hypothetical protein